MPSHPLFCGAHFGPPLHLFKSAATPFALGVPLAGGANGNAGRVGGGGIPLHPRRLRLGWHRKLVGLALVVVHHQRIHLGQGAGGRGQGHTVGRGFMRSPVVNSGFDVSNVYASQVRKRFSSQFSLLEGGQS